MMNLEYHTRTLLVDNDMAAGLNMAIQEFSSAMNRPDIKIAIEKTTDKYTTVTLVNFNDNDLMLFGYFYYRSMLTTAPVLITPN